MTKHHPSREMVNILRDISDLLGVEMAEGTDSFGRTFVDIEIGGLRRMHDLALDRGHEQVAEDIRHMLATGERHQP
jgi:hypothetical protein